jgi:hypothetical protein
MLINTEVLDTAETKPVIFAGPSEEQQQAQVELAVQEGHLTVSLLRPDGGEVSDNLK